MDKISVFSLLFYWDLMFTFENTNSNETVPKIDRLAGIECYCTDFREIGGSIKKIMKVLEYQK